MGSFTEIGNKQSSKTMISRQMTAMEKSDSYNDKLNRAETKHHLTLAPGTRAPGRSVTGFSGDPADLRKSCD